MPEESPSKKQKSIPDGLRTFSFDVKGQRGNMPAVGLGTATLKGETCIEAVRAAIRAGYRLIDTALLYDNQEAVGMGIKQAIEAGEVTRQDLFITTKVAFYPAHADGTNTWLPGGTFHDCNKKGKEETLKAVGLCLQKLQLDYVDLLLIHNPCTDITEFQASCCPHFFELKDSPLTSEERTMVLNARLARVKYDRASAEASRGETWQALEEVQKQGKCKYIGVSNCPLMLVKAMEEYATVMPAVNQLELHPRFSSPSLRKLAEETGMLLTGYGSGNSVNIEKGLEKGTVINQIAARLGKSHMAVVLRWTLQSGVCVIPRTSTVAHIEENISVIGDNFNLSNDDMVAIDALNEAHPYYWSPLPHLPPGTTVDK